MHPEDATCLALLDGELSPGTRAEVVRHLAGCGGCRLNLGELEYAKDEVSGWLNLLESRAPLRTAEAIRQRARPRTRQRQFLVAASMLLAFATAAGATFHFGVLNGLLGRRAGVELMPTRRTQGVNHPQTPGPSGIALSPRGALEVVFQRRQEKGTIRIAFADTPAVSIVASSIASYRVERGRVTISNDEDSSGSYTITLPRTLSRISVRVASETVFSKRGGSIVTAPAADGAGGYVIPLARAGSRP